MNVRVKRVTMGTEKYAKVRYDLFVVDRCMSTFFTFQHLFIWRGSVTCVDLKCADSYNN